MVLASEQDVASSCFLVLRLTVLSEAFARGTMYSTLGGCCINLQHVERRNTLAPAVYRLARKTVAREATQTEDRGSRRTTARVIFMWAKRSCMYKFSRENQQAVQPHVDETDEMYKYMMKNTPQTPAALPSGSRWGESTRTRASVVTSLGTQVS